VSLLLLLLFFYYFHSYVCYYCHYIYTHLTPLHLQAQSTSAIQTNSPSKNSPKWQPPPPSPRPPPPHPQQVLELIPSSTSKIIFLPCPHDDPTQRKPDIAGAARLRAPFPPPLRIAPNYFPSLTRALAVAAEKLGWAPVVQIKEAKAPFCRRSLACALLLTPCAGPCRHDQVLRFD